MKQANLILTSVIVTSVVFLSACEPEDPEDVSVSSRDKDAVNSDLATKKAYEREKERLHLEAMRMEAERLAEIEREELERKESERIEAERKRAEAARVEAERKRKAAEAKARKDSQVAQAQKAKAPPSRATSYVGQAQTYELTYYTAQCNGCTGQSASGVWVNKSTHYEGYRVLAAPKHIPFYSILRITLADGTSYDGIVLDRGGDIKNGRLDVLTATRDEAYRNGRHKAQVQVVRRGK